MKLKNVIGICIALFFAHINYSKTMSIIWDFGFTLVETSELGVAGEIGWGTCIGNFFNGTGSKTYLRNTMYAILLQGSGPQEGDDPNMFVRDENGAALPLIMAKEWLTNNLNSQEIIARADQFIEEWDTQKKFHHSGEKKMLKGIMRTIFAPELIAKHTHPNKKALQLVKQCRLRGHRQYILSNWEKESFEQVYTNKLNQPLFKYFKRNAITISGDCGMIKPHANIFIYFLEKNNLNPADCIFIDDQEENVIQARACGMQALHLKRGDYATIEKELKNMGVIS